MRINKIHHYLGLIISVAILVISLTGTLLIWKKEYLWLSIVSARQTPTTQTIDLARAIEAIKNSHGVDEVTFINLNIEDLALHKVYLKNKRYAFHDKNGQLVQQWSDNQRLEDWLLDLHHRFLLGNKIGLNIAGFSGLVLIPLALVGFYLWWPRRRLLKLGVLPKRQAKGRHLRGALLISHGNIGAMSLLPILIIAITGVVLVYPSQSRQVLLEPFTHQTVLNNVIPPFDSLSGKTEVTWQRAIERSLALYPDSTVRWVSLPSAKSKKITIGLHQADNWNKSGQTSIAFHSQSGRMFSNKNGLNEPALKRLFNFSYPLHAGKLGLWFRILLSLFGISLFCIAGYGLLSFSKR